MTTLLWFIVAALCEIAGCFAFWACLRLDRSIFWAIPGCASLIIFAVALTRVETAYAGRAYAAYGGIYVAASIMWLLLVERQSPDRWDLIGGFIVLVGSGLILWGPRSA